MGTGGVVSGSGDGHHPARAERDEGLIDDDLVGLRVVTSRVGLAEGQSCVGSPGINFVEIGKYDCKGQEVEEEIGQ